MNSMQEFGGIYGLGYLGVRSDDLAAWDRFAIDSLGFGAVAAPGDERRYKWDVRSHRLAVRQGAPGLDYIGWEVRNERELDALADLLDREGIPAKQGTADAAASRGVMEMLTCTDPAGNDLEFFWGATVQETKPLDSRHDVRFVTADLGMGHLVLTTSHYDDLVEFYMRVLGFAATDVMDGHPRVSFLGCNPRHHSIGIVGAPVESLNHFMVEVEDFDMVGCAYDRVQEQGLQLVMTLGRHWNDHMTSFYVQSPSGFAVEFGWGGRTIDRDTWTTVRGSGEISFWGHKPMTAELKALMDA
jgi:2,3-dihydroxybiphenyl 1,2-dioxygenase